MKSDYYRLSSQKWLPPPYKPCMEMHMHFPFFGSSILDCISSLLVYV